MIHEISLKVNGKEVKASVESQMTLLRFLRDHLQLTGTKEGCEQGECGACTVLLDGKPVNACLTLAVKTRGREVTTIEGLGDERNLHPLQKAFIDHFAVQCGFCTPGMILTAAALL
ncbi:MAG: (2Fe-2S)-binding protein, partial [Deltaproteobacteria bacterium]